MRLTRYAVALMAFAIIGYNLGVAIYAIVTVFGYMAAVATLLTPFICVLILIELRRTASC